MARGECQVEKSFLANPVFAVKVNHAPIHVLTKITKYLYIIKIAKFDIYLKFVYVYTIAMSISTKNQGSTPPIPGDL